MSAPISASSTETARFCLPTLCIMSRTLQQPDKNQGGDGFKPAPARAHAPNRDVASIIICKV